jgi:ribosomal protein S18 acetylase RimI-like enzyme
MMETKGKMRNKPTTIREAKPEDYHTCLPLLTSLYHGDIGPDFKSSFEDYANSENSVVLVSERSGNVNGVLMGSYCSDIDWEGKTARIDAIVVDDKYRKTGIGRELVNRFIKLSEKKNCRAIKSRVNIRNENAQTFHERLGFNKADTYEYILEFEKR